jgi:serine phosphatase RsbU (regulator of sigma subunit)
MLPQNVPQLPHLEVAARMETATEVGGDYYDFELDENGVLTVAIGDATGHGMRAGTMVTATKSLFNAIGKEPDLTGTLGRCTRALKRMNFRKLSMALTLVQVDGAMLTIAAAGMPPVYIFRAASGRVEAVEIPGMPLGTFTGFQYRREAIELEPGDVAVLMSDGFPERLDSEGEPLGYDHAVEEIAAAASGTPAEIIDVLFAASERWGGGRPQDDDLTFVVLKRPAVSE